MAEESPKMAGKVFALSVLIVSLIIAIAGLYIVLTNWNARSGDPMALGLSAIVAILILLIISMMWNISKGLSKELEEES